MTAINPARLKIQCVKLRESFQDPDKFIAGLHDLLTFYASRIRQSSITHSSVKMPTYQVPSPVLRGLELELIEETYQFPEETLTLVDFLWKEDYLEFRQLAVILIGAIPTTSDKDILKRIQNWIKTPVEDLRRQIMTRGLQLLRMEEKYLVLDVLKNLAVSSDKKDRQAALFGLVPFAEDSEFYDLPKIYKVLGEILMTEETIFIKEITDLIRSLKKRSESETAYFLVRQLARASKPRVFRIIRQIIGDFNIESQEVLREGIKTYS
jgi:hypothetical protein